MVGCFGGPRARSPSIPSFPEVHTMKLVCDNTHEHEPWGLVKQGNKRVFATSLEVRYPALLREAIVHAYVLRLSAQGFQPAEPSSQQFHRAC